MTPVKRSAASMLAALALADMLSGGCGRKPEPPAPASLAPITAAPGETPSTALTKKENAPNIKVRRDKDGNYSWEITGKDVKSIIGADASLRRRFEPKGEPAD